MPEPRVVFIAKVDPDLKKRFYDLVKRKYRGLRGGVSAETEHMMAEWLRAQDTQIHARLNPVGRPLRHRACNEIIHWLKDHNFWNQCTVTALRDAIASVRGSDPRTIRRWTTELIRTGRLKPISHITWEIIG